MGSLDTSQVVIGMLALFVVYSIFNTWSLRDKIFCTFIRQDKTEINKYAKFAQNRIDFDGRWFNIVTNRVTLKLVWMGVVPTWVIRVKIP